MHIIETDPKIIEEQRSEFKNRKGEAILFVIRKIADKQSGGIDFILSELKKHYEIIATKPVSWQFRWFKSSKMRGGKWKRGGKPMLAVIVFDPEPIIREREESEKHHPLVFNARQFFKPETRESFSQKFGIKLKLNPFHSTDNEFEAWDHLHLFFSESEIDEINKKISKRRKELNA